jgi:para-aminobenzoate synthetase/4-amino-4-deoxychorismate lyase
MNILFEFERKPLRFKDPERIISCYDPAHLPEAFAQVEGALRNGFFVAGLLSYESGYAFEKKLCRATQHDFPLLYFGCYTSPIQEKSQVQPHEEESGITGVAFNISKAAYDKNIGRIRDHIRAGDVYQITYCLKVTFTLRGCASGLYRKLLQRQPVPYPAYLEAGEFTILSLSPEMFIKKQDRFIVTKPMKGTWPRGEGVLSDLFARQRFQFDSKNRAENVMIADLLRNDLGRMGRAVRAPRLFEVTPYKTLFQMTSTVTADIAQDITLYELFRNLFPSGSVTGAPKIRAMEIIREIEGEERRIYTGAIGYITPSRDLFFNIPIRTLLLRKAQGEMGIGGGIVWDSTPDGEWAEGMLKARFLTELDRGYNRC